MKKFFRNNGLSVVLLGIFLLFWGAQIFVGRLEYNEERSEWGLPSVNVGEYLQSSHFWEATGENWESEFLQMGAYVFLTIFLFQKGSSESKDPDEESPQDRDPRLDRHKPGVPWPVRRGGWVLRVYEHSLTLAFALLFFGAVLIHAGGGVCLHNEELAALGKPTLSYLGYLGSSKFWFESFQ